ncbi:RagB/SusD family nutrient uptake outer membrane protein [Sphingobacterium faecium]|uniref:RagB/SusD family nutrient uptake outer membrane protein n=1 Tax=Sphingobacterium faecium TaxID=34087 RepID=UPI00320AC55C
MKITFIYVILGLGIILSSCERYLDLKPDKSQVIPASLQDCQALLNSSLNEAFFPQAIEISSDDYVLNTDGFQEMILEDRQTAVWQVNAQVQFGNWSGPYNRIQVANQILSTLSKIEPAPSQQAEWNQIKGATLLLRSMCFFSLAQTFTLPYDPATAGQDLGIPLKVTPSLSEPIDRGTVQQTHDRIITDLNEAIGLLPDRAPSAIATRTIPTPVRAAAQAALARVYLSMGDYTNALILADASLNRYNTLIDYKDLDNDSYVPLEAYNAEVLYSYSGGGNVPFGNGTIAPTVYQMYVAGDLRKDVFFGPDITQSYVFTGAYQPYTIFAGLATDEVYLIRAECRARAGNAALAMADLNLLRSKRWDNNYTPLVAATAQEALDLIIAERRKELVYRGLRWFDLRRLNKDPRYAVTLTRTIDGQTYTLPPNDLRYALPIPREVLEREDMPQNRR